MDVRVGLWGKLSAEELMLLNCLRVPWTARSNQSILKEISPRCSLEGLMLKLKLQSFGHLMQRADSFEKTLMSDIWREEEKGMTKDEMVGWHHRQWTWIWASSGSWWRIQKPGVLQSMGSQRVGHNWLNWAELNWFCDSPIVFFSIFPREVLT